MTIGNNNYNYNSNYNSNNHHSSISPAQAWAILARHARDEIASLRLKELCRDDDRVAALVEVYQSRKRTTSNNILIADLSRQRMTDTTLHHLLCLSTSMGLKQFIRQVSWGRNDPNIPIFRPYNASAVHEHEREREHTMHTATAALNHDSNSNTKNVPEDEQHSQHYGNKNKNNTQKVMLPSMHLALRVPPTDNDNKNNNTPHAMLDGSTNVLPSIHRTWDRIRELADAVRAGRRRGATGAILQHVVVIGTASVALQSLQFLYTALRHDQTAAMAREAIMATTTESRLRHILATTGLSAAATLHTAASAATAGSTSASATTAAAAAAAAKGGTPRTLRCIASTDPQQLLLALEGLDPATTLVVSWAVTGHEATATVTRTIKQWLVQGMSSSSSSPTRMVVSTVSNSTMLSAKKNHHAQKSGGTYTGGGSGSDTTGAAAAAGTKHHHAGSSVSSTGGGPPTIDVSSHMILVTGNERIVEAMGSTSIHSNSNIPTMFVLPPYARCESFLSCSYATILPLALVFGWDTARRILDGCHDMDQHFVDTNPRHNLPVLLALMDIWNDCMVQASTSSSSSSSSSSSGGGGGSGRHGGGSVTARIVTPGTAALGKYPQYCAALESHVCGGASPTRTAAASLVVANDDSGLWDRTLQPPQASSSSSSSGVPFNTTSSNSNNTSMNAELVMTLDGQTDFIASRIAGTAHNNNSSVHHVAHDELVCRRLAQADALANSGTTGRPSVLLWTHTLDAFGCGQLLALAEHRALVKAHLWQVDPFVSSITAASQVVPTRTVDQYANDLQRLVLQQEEDGDDDDTDRLTLATKTILTHYAGMVRERQQHAANSRGGA